MIRRFVRHARTPATPAGLMVVLLSLAMPIGTDAVLAQSGGSTGGASGGASGGGTSGATGSPSGAGSGAADTSPTGGPSPRAPATGPQSRSPATPPSTVPQRDTGVRQVPSPGNAEPNSPIYRQDTQPGDLLTPRAPTTSSPQTDSPPGGGGGGAGSAGGAGGGDPLMPTDPAGNPAGPGSERSTTSIGEEPDRIKRGGGAAGADLEDCMKLWDSSTHMTKERWKETCERLGR